MRLPAIFSLIAFFCLSCSEEESAPAPNVEQGFQAAGLLVDDYEDGESPDWFSYEQFGENMVNEHSDDQAAGHGESYLKIGGEVVWDWLVLYTDYSAAVFSDSLEMTYPLPIDPESFYFNVMLKAPLEIENELVVIQFMEDENGDGEYDFNTEDHYIFQLEDLSSDWQIHSILYNDLSSQLYDEPTPPNGNGIKEPNKLLQIRVLLLADPSSGYTEVHMDYMTFTAGEPLVL